jgi:hypothetical protein
VKPEPPKPGLSGQAQASTSLCMMWHLQEASFLSILAQNMMTAFWPLFIAFFSSHKQKKANGQNTNEESYTLDKQ